METITNAKDFYDLTNNETEIRDKIVTIVEPISDDIMSPDNEVSDFVNIIFSNVFFKDCVFNDAQFIKCTFDNCKFINCKWEYRLAFYRSEFFSCDIESMLTKNKDQELTINECEFKFCNFKDTKIDEMGLRMTMFYYCRFPYKVYIISDGFKSKFIFPDKENNDQLINSLEQSFGPIPDEDEVTTIDEMKFGYKKIKKEFNNTSN